MNPLHRTVLAAALAATAFLAGCASTPAPTLLTLPSVSAVSAANVVRTAPADAPVLALARVDVPEYLVSRRVRYRTDSATLAEWPDTYWAERLEVSVSREFAQALRERLAAWRVCDSNCAELAPTAALRVVLTRMDYQRGATVLRASARVVINTSERIPRSIVAQDRVYEVAVRGDSAQAQARAYADLLVAVAADAAQLMPAPSELKAPAPIR